MDKQYETVSLEDLATMCNMIELCQQRGAFKMNELAAVGGVYERVSGFVRFTSEQSQQAAQSEPQEAPVAAKE